MNYRHIYHAGNFADVVKHICLISLIKNSVIKPKPFAVLDSFAGTGLYDLLSEESNKTQESVRGVQRVIDTINSLSSSVSNNLSKNFNIPSILLDYLSCIEYTSSGSNGIIYPGSPKICAFFMRGIDRLVACELHPVDARTLKYNFYKDNRVEVHNIDGYKSFKAFLPLTERRGLILIDPPFEKPTEFDMIADSIAFISKRFSAATTLIWHPIKNDHHKLLYTTLDNLKQEYIKITCCAPDIDDAHSLKSTPYMNKCGLIIINPPNILPLLHDAFTFLTKNIFINHQTEVATI
jgi:23S rRNA (adenine2030-N6)-methyltransferase